MIIFSIIIIALSAFTGTLFLANGYEVNEQYEGTINAGLGNSFILTGTALYFISFLTLLGLIFIVI